MQFKITETFILPKAEWLRTKPTISDDYWHECVFGERQIKTSAGTIEINIYIFAKGSNNSAGTVEISAEVP